MAARRREWRGAGFLPAMAGQIRSCSRRPPPCGLETSSPSPRKARQVSLVTTPSATLTGLNSPWALAFDGSGNLYVANIERQHGEQVRSGEHHAQRHPHRAEQLPTPWPSTAAATSTWPTATGNGTVSKFAPGSTTPSATLTGLSNPYALAFDGSGNLYVANDMAAAR